MRLSSDCACIEEERTWDHLGCDSWWIEDIRGLSGLGAGTQGTWLD